jgi:hydroxylamine reductase (hybrid-cluster protein)
MENAVKSGLQITVAGKGGVGNTTASAVWSHDGSQAASHVLTPNYRFKNSHEFYQLAEELGIKTNTRSDKEIAVDVGSIGLGELGKREGYQLRTKHAPVPRQRLWQKHDVVPRAIDREAIKALFRCTPGVDQANKTLINHASRISLADKFGGLSRPQMFKKEN